MNIGERDELTIQIFLTYLRDYGDGSITNVGFAGQEYRLVTEQQLQELPLLSDNDLEKFAKSIGGGKAPGRAKSDVYINGAGVSLKSLRAAPPALINHTSRPGFHRVCNAVGCDIAVLDEIIDNYWDRREKGIISEDTKISDPNCPFRDYKDYLKPILEYFLFIGTGSSDSPYPASSLLEFSDPLNMHTWRFLNTDEAVDAVWNKLVFSLRAKKGMPEGYNLNTYKGPNAQSIARWVRFNSGDYRGALHIRATK